MSPLTPQVRYLGGAVSWRSGLAVDCDGCPRCYAPPPLVGLDHLANAGWHGRWWGIAVDAHGQPVVQGPDDPAPGYYVSTTALQDHHFPTTDPRRYVDSERVPFISVPPELTRMHGVHLGDAAMVCYKGIEAPAIVADLGPALHYGEGSMALAAALGVDPSPKHGGIGAGVVFLVWPGSSRGWPVPLSEVDFHARALYAEWGGAARVAEMYP